MKFPKRFELKSLCKEMARHIKTRNQTWRQHQKTGESWSIWAELSKGLKWNSYDYRHHHIAYCLLRGTPYERIEPKVLDGNEPNWELIESIKQKYLDVEVSDAAAVVCSGPA